MAEKALSRLTPPEGAVKKKESGLVVVLVLETEKLPVKDTADKNPVLVVVHTHVLKGAKCLCTVGCQSVVSTTHFAKNTLFSTLAICRDSLLVVL
jgi:hypothetical protein